MSEPIYPAPVLPRIPPPPEYPANTEAAWREWDAYLRAIEIHNHATHVGVGLKNYTHRTASAARTADAINTLAAAIGGWKPPVTKAPA